MTNFEKLYHKIALQIINRCHGGIKITKHGKVLEMYDPGRHIWSKGMVGLLIKEECINANLRDWEATHVRNHIIQELLLRAKKN